MSFRDSIFNQSPPWLRGRVGSRLLYAPALLLDVLGDWLIEGMLARFPDTAPDDALGFIGNDRTIDRGPAETAEQYRPRLRGAITSHRNQGGARTMLSQIAAYFTNVATPPLRAVSDHSVWHVYDWMTGLTTKVVASANWNWDSFTGTRWWRGWVILDTSAGPYTRGNWGDSGLNWGESGNAWGVDATVIEINNILRIIRRWKPGNVVAKYLILTFDSSLFEHTDSAPPNPNGDYDDPANWNPDATYIPVGN